jgi:hypothetical protein
LTYEDVNDDPNEHTEDHEEERRRGRDEEEYENSDRELDDQEVEDAPEINEYEALRLRNIARNKDIFVELGLTKPEAPPKVSNEFIEH